VSLEQVALALGLAAIPPSIAQFARAAMLRTALRGSKPSERASILGSLAKIQPFTPSTLSRDPVRRMRTSLRSGNGWLRRRSVYTEDADIIRR
jgi:hypothetical protein